MWSGCGSANRKIHIWFQVDISGKEVLSACDCKPMKCWCLEGLDCCCIFLIIEFLNASIILRGEPLCVHIASIFTVANTCGKS